MGSYLQCHMTLWSRTLARSRDKLKPLDLNYYSAYDHQAWQGADLPLGVPNRYSHLTFNLVVLLSWLTKNISITSVLMGTKLYNQTHQNDAILVKDVVLFF